MKVICQHCGYKWDYKGVGKFYATCPQCYYKVPLLSRPVSGAQTVLRIASRELSEKVKGILDELGIKYEVR